MNTTLIPSNRKTLMLRNIEEMLVSNGVICKCQRNTFRKTIAYDFLSLIELYIDDIENDSNENMETQYINDSLAERFHQNNFAH